MSVTIHPRAVEIVARCFRPPELPSLGDRRDQYSRRRQDRHINATTASLTRFDVREVVPHGGG